MPRSRVLTLFAFILLIAAAATGAAIAAEPDEPLAAGAPPVVSYQGQVAVDGTPFAGPIGNFKFAIVNQAGTTTYWSNDGTSWRGSEPDTVVSLGVEQGRFSVLLGDTALKNMTTLPASAFDGTARYLRVWFNATGAGGSFTQLTPDRRIAAAPYALVATEADTLDGKHAHQVCDPLHRASPPRPSGIAIPEVGLGSIGDPSITIGADGLPVMSYHREAEGLKVVHCGDAACTSGNTITTVDSSADVGLYNSIAIGADGLPVISYYDATNGDLKVAHCGDAACSGRDNTVTTIDGAKGDAGRWSTSIAIGADGLPVISYYDYTLTDLKVAHCGDAACSSNITLTRVDTTGDVGQYSSIAAGADGLPVISYYDETNGDLKVAHCGDATCSSGNLLTIVDSSGYQATSLTIGADGLPLIAYHTYAEHSMDLRVVHCGDATCASGNLKTTVDHLLTGYPSLTIGADGLPVISYTNGDFFDLYVLHCGNAACSGGNTITTRVHDGDVGSTAITIGMDGLPVISYGVWNRNPTDYQLTVMHCSNTFCTPYFRRR